MRLDGSATAPLPTRAELEGLGQRSNGAGALRVFTHFGAIAALGGLIVWVLAVAGVAYALPLVVAQGWLVAFLFMPLHETAHKTAFASRRVNVIVGNICAAAVFLPYEYYTLFHWAHHRHTQDPERDPELVAGIAPPATAGGLGVWFLGVRQLLGRARLLLRHAATGRVTAPWVPTGKRSLVVHEARVLVATYAGLLLVSWIAGSALLLWVWLVPVLVGQAFLRPYLLAEHSGCGEGRDAFDNTRTTFTAALVRWFTGRMEHALPRRAPRVSKHSLPCAPAAACQGRRQAAAPFTISARRLPGKRHDWLILRCG